VPRKKKEKAPTSALGEFEGLPVLAVGIELPGAAGGLRDPLRVDPLILHGGEQAFATFELVTNKVRFDPVKVDDVLIGWTRVHVMGVENATFVDENLVRDQLDEMARRVAERKEADEAAKRRESGNVNLDDALHEKDHAAGRHSDGLVQGCPECDAEQTAADAEAMGDG
jgi:hypothetical protein